MGREVVGGGAARCSPAVFAHRAANLACTVIYAIHFTVLHCIAWWESSLRSRRTRSPPSLSAGSLMLTDWYSPLKEQGTKNGPCTI